MKAVVLPAFGQALILEERPVPEPAAGEALIRVKASGLCYSDLKIRDGKNPKANPPLVLGHEFSGVVEGLGSGAKRFKVGARVIGAPDCACGRCPSCLKGNTNLCEFLERFGFELDGSHQEYLAVPEENLVPLPESISFEEGAILPDAVATVFHAIIDRGRVHAGEWLAIQGIGGLGIHAVMVGRLAGCRVIALDLEQERLELASQYGAEAGINPESENVVEKVMALTDGRGIDCYVDLLGTKETLETALMCLAREGRLVVAGYLTPEFSVSPYRLLKEGLQVLGSRNAPRSVIWELVRLTEAGLLKPLVSRTFPLEEANQAYLELRERRILGRGVLLP